MPKDNSNLAEILNAIQENNVDDVKYFIKIKLKAINKDKSSNSSSSFSLSCMSDNVTRQQKDDLEVIVMEATLQKDPTILVFLMKKGLNINFVCSQGGGCRIPLHSAVGRGYHDTLEALLEGNANVNAKDNHGRTALHLAAVNCDVVAARMLLFCGAKVKMVDKEGKTPLQFAAKYGHVDLVRELLEHNAEIYEENQKGYSPLHIAAMEGHVPLLDMFGYCIDIDTTSKCDDRDDNETAALHLACQRGLIESARFMVERFAANVNIQDSMLNNPLHYTVMNKHDPKRMRKKESVSAVAEYLIKSNVSINQQNFKGDTPLHLAAANQHHRIVELLLMSGASPHTKNKSGFTPKDLIPGYDATMKQIFVRCAPFSAAYITLSNMISKTSDISVCENSSSNSAGNNKGTDQKSVFSSNHSVVSSSPCSSIKSPCCSPVKSGRINLLQSVESDTGVQTYKTVVQTSYDI